MNIIPVIYKNQPVLNFKGKKETSNPNNTQSQSIQNNSPDYFIDPKVYVGYLYNKKAKEVNDYLNQTNIHTNKQTAGMDNIVIDTMIANLINMAKLIGLPPEDEKNTIPSLITYNAENYIQECELLNNEKIKTANLVFEEDIKALEKMGVDEEDIEDIKKDGYEMLKELKNKIDGTNKSLRTNQSKIQNALNINADAYNYRIFSAIKAGFNGDARKAILELTSNTILIIPPEIKNNNDGTYTYTYKNSKTTTTIKRNAQNLDYISAVEKENDTGDMIFNLQFNKDGSIKKLKIKNEINDTEITIYQDKDTDSLKVQEREKNTIADRNFAFVNGKLLETSFNYYHLQ